MKENKKSNDIRHPSNRSVKWGKILLISLACLIVAAVVGGFVYIKTLRPNVDTGVPFETPKVTDPVNTADSDTTAVPEKVYERDTERVNFLVMGRDLAGWNTDVMMLVNFDMREKRISVMQLPRDTCFRFAGSRSKLNATLIHMRNKAYDDSGRNMSGNELTKEGLKGFAEALEKSLCIQIDGCAIINLSGFRNVIDILGGVNINVPYDMDYEDPEQDLYIHLKAGEQVLDGEKAEMFVRFRSGYVQGDIGRVNAQKIFLTALFKQFKSSLTLSTIPKLAEQAVKEIVTDVPLTDIIAYAKELWSVDLENVVMMTLPGTDARTEVNSGAWYYVINRQLALDMINEYFNVYSEDITDEMFDSENLFIDPKLENFKNIYFADPSDPSCIFYSDITTGEEIDDGKIKIPLNP